MSDAGAARGLRGPMQREKRDAAASFGMQWKDDGRRTPRIIPRLGRNARATRERRRPSSEESQQCSND